MKYFALAAFVVLLPFVTPFSTPSDGSDLMASLGAHDSKSTADVHRRLTYHRDAILAIIRGADQPLREEIKPMLLQLAAKVTEHFQEPDESKPMAETHFQARDELEFLEVQEESSTSAGRRGGQSAMGGFAWAIAASGNRAGNSERQLGQDSSSQVEEKRGRGRPERQLGQDSPSPVQAAAQSATAKVESAAAQVATGRRRKGETWETKHGTTCVTSGRVERCKDKYGKCPHHCWEYSGGWTCPGCWDQEDDARKLASAITATWESKRGLEYCNKYKSSTHSNVTKVGSAVSADIEALQKAFGEENHDLHEINVSEVAKKFRWSDHVMMHRSGVHAVRKRGADVLLLCSSWTAVCLRTPPSHGQKCKTVRQVLGCKKRQHAKFEDCNTWVSVNKVTLPNFA